VPLYHQVLKSHQVLKPGNMFHSGTRLTIDMNVYLIAIEVSNFRFPCTFPIYAQLVTKLIPKGDHLIEV
jgi:hypothetical protein